VIVSHSVFIWFITSMVLFLCTTAGIRDVYVLTRLLRQSEYTPEEKDLLFGAVTGLVMCLIGFGGVVKFHLL
jgi:hypothetical protein